MNKYPNLFRPIKLGDLTLRNRIFQAPMSAPNLSPEGYFTLDSIAFFEATPCDVYGKHHLELLHGELWSNPLFALYPESGKNHKKKLP